MSRVVHVHQLLELGNVILGDIPLLLESDEDDSESASDHLFALSLINHIFQFLVKGLRLILSIENLATDSVQESDLVHSETLRRLHLEWLYRQLTCAIGLSLHKGRLGVIFLVDLENRIESFLVESKFETAKRFAIVAIRTERVDQGCQVEPLSGVFELTGEEVAAAGVVDATKVLRIYLDTREVVVKSHVVCLVLLLPVASLVGSTLDSIPFRKPELS